MKYIKLFEEYSERDYDRILDIYNDVGLEGMTPEEIEYLKSGGETKTPVERDYKQHKIYQTNLDKITNALNRLHNYDVDTILSTLAPIIIESNMEKLYWMPMIFIVLHRLQEQNKLDKNTINTVFSEIRDGYLERYKDELEDIENLLWDIDEEDEDFKERFNELSVYNFNTILHFAEGIKKDYLPPNPDKEELQRVKNNIEVFLYKLVDQNKIDRNTVENVLSKI